MPGGDRTGPLGLGPMTGRAAGYCAGYSMLGYANPTYGRGRGFGRGWGRGHGWNRGAYSYEARDYGAPYGNQYNPQMTSQQETDMLKERAKVMQEEIKSINERISELESTAKKTK